MSVQFFSPSELDAFHRDGFVIVQGMADRKTLAPIKTVSELHLAKALPPVEYEADVHYPGAPISYDVPGGRTMRRLLNAYSRDRSIAQWATGVSVAGRLRQLLGARVELALAHHNCVMTKQPRYSSATYWHQDIRYWSFARADLVSVWLALGQETIVNGCLRILPGSQNMEFRDNQLDAAKFLREDLIENHSLLQTQTAIELEAGDALFFHCRLFHAAGRNQSEMTKFSLVFTYHAADNPPLAGTRSATYPQVMLG